MRYIYPYSKRRVLFSCVLVIVSIIFAFLTLRDLTSVLLFCVYAFLFTTIFLVLKFYLYSKKAQEKLGPSYVQEENRSWGLPFAISLVVIAGFLPVFFLLLLLLFLPPLTWFTFIVGFIAGVNIPEIILYLCFQRT